MFLWISAKKKWCKRNQQQNAMKKIQKCGHINKTTKTNKRHHIFINVKKNLKKNLKFINVKKLNTHIMMNLNDCNSKLWFIIIKFNNVYYWIIISQIQKFAEIWNQKIYIFCVEHFQRRFFFIDDFEKHFDI